MTADISAGSPLKLKAKLLLQQFKQRLVAMDQLVLWTVVVPTVVATLYFGLIASDVYVCESRFVVRSQQRETGVSLGSLLKGGSSESSVEDNYGVRDFMLSRDALRQLEDELHLSSLFSASSVDRFSRFGGLDFDSSFEALYRYYAHRVAIDVDSTSSISTLVVTAFGADEAYRINEMLLRSGERFVNALNERARQDTVRFAQAEAEDAEKKAQAATLALSGYRSAHSLFNPEAQSTLRLQQVGKLQDELIATRTQLAQMKTLAPQSPQIPALQKRVQTLQSQEADEMAKAAGRSAPAEQSAEFERLVLERQFADKQLEASLASLEQARYEAQRKQLYLARIVQPSAPDVATRPRRLRSIFATFVLGLMVCGILNILVAGLREHRD
jgi:capsular polysaccharide transport system permease protein